jgi:hypothetical protein
MSLQQIEEALRAGPPDEPAYAALPMRDLESRGRRERPIWPQALGAVGLLGLLLFVLLVRPPARPAVGSGSPSSPNDVPLPAGVIPWSEATPEPVETVRPPTIGETCTPDQLAAIALPPQGAGGSTVGAVGLVNVGRQACQLAGFPSLELVDAAGRTVVAAAEHLSTGPGDGTPVSLRPETPNPDGYVDEARVAYVWSNWCGEAKPGVAEIVLGLPSGRSLLRIPTDPLGPPRCDIPDGATSLSVGAFEFVDSPPPAQADTGLQMRLDPPATAVAGERLRYEVVLTNSSRTPVAFATCPGFEQRLGVLDGPEVADRRRLNCEGAGSVAPGEVARFEMLLDVPAWMPTGSAVLSWQLEGTTLAEKREIVIVPAGG